MICLEYHEKRIADLLHESDHHRHNSNEEFFRKNKDSLMLSQETRHEMFDKLKSLSGQL